MSEEIVVVPLSQLMRGKYQVHNPWPPEMRAKLVRELREGGKINVPPIIDENNDVLDGEQRIGSAEEAGRTEQQCRRITGLSEDAKWRIAFGQEMRRPQERGREARRKLVAAALRRLSHRSDGYISTMLLDVSDKLVRSVRKDLIAKGEIKDHDFLLGLDGTQQPASKPSRKKSKAAGEGQQAEEGQQEEGQGTHLAEEGQQVRQAEEADQGAEEAQPAEGQQAEGGEQGMAQEAEDREKAEEAGKEGEKAEEAGKEGEEAEEAEEALQSEGQQTQEGQEAQPADKPKKNRGRRTATGRQSWSGVTARREPGRLVIECEHLDQMLPQDLTSLDVLHVWDPAATHVSVLLNATRPTLVVYQPRE